MTDHSLVEFRFSNRFPPGNSAMIRREWYPFSITQMFHHFNQSFVRSNVKCMRLAKEVTKPECSTSKWTKRKSFRFANGRLGFILSDSELTIMALPSGWKATVKFETSFSFRPLSCICKIAISPKAEWTKHQTQTRRYKKHHIRLLSSVPGRYQSKLNRMALDVYSISVFRTDIS